MKSVKKIGLLAATVALVSVCHASVVSWNFAFYGEVPIDGSGTAGVENAAYWNDTWLEGGGVNPHSPMLNLRDSTGDATTMDISWVSGNWGGYRIQGSHPGLDTDGTYNKEMLNGYADAVNSSSITLAEIPYPDYKIIAYFSSDVAGRQGSVSNGTDTFYFNTLGPDSINDASGNALFVQATDTTTNG